MVSLFQQPTFFVVILSETLHENLSKAKVAMLSLVRTFFSPQGFNGELCTKVWIKPRCKW